jgi:hypothetical protein
VSGKRLLLGIWFEQLCSVWPCMAETIPFKLPNNDFHDSFDVQKSFIESEVTQSQSGRPPRGPLGQLWIDARVRIRIDLVTRSVWNDLEPGNYCLTIDKWDEGNLLKQDSGSSGGLNDRRARCDIATNYMQRSMPIDARQLVEPEKRGPLGIPALVRLYRFDPTAVLLTEWLDLVCLLSEGSGTALNWKLELPIVWRRVLARITDGDVVDAVIQGGSEVVQPLAKENCDKRRDGSCLVHAQRKVPLVVALERKVERVLIFREEGVPIGDCGISVGRCSVNTVPTPLEWSPSPVHSQVASDGRSGEGESADGERLHDPGAQS